MNFLFEFGSISYFYTVFYGVTCERIVVSRKRKRERNREYSFFRLYFSLISNFFVCSGVSCLTLLFVWESGTLSGIVNNWWSRSVSGCGYVRVRNKAKKNTIWWWFIEMNYRWSFNKTHTTMEMNGKKCKRNKICGEKPKLLELCIWLIYGHICRLHF